jgi:beta-ribofuranosylaminobenzene 5'-phosphate synthase
LRSVRIRTPARLHFGLFADGRGERKFGGVGMAIDKPGFEFEMRLAAEDSVIAPMDASLALRIPRLLARLRQHWQLPPVEVHFEEVIPHHVGLGSGTQLAMSIGEAAAQLMRLPATYEALARMLGRGARSGIGFHAFRGVAFIIDGGKVDENEIPEVISSAGWPFDWPVVLLHPSLPPGMHGNAESDAFRERIVIPEETSKRLFALAVRDIAPAVLRRNYSAFAQSLYEYNRLSGACFAELQGGVYSSPLLDELVQTARNLGCPAVGQSSWGPTLFTIHRSHKAARKFLAQIAELRPELDTTFTGPGANPIDDGEVGTQMLVSVRSAAEAEDASSCGVDVIDVKEPSRGPLGDADESTRNAVVNWWNDILVEYVGGDRVRRHVDLSFAFGDLSNADRIARAQRSTKSLRTRHFWKIGFAGELRRNDWDERFLNLAKQVAERSEAGPASLIPVAYADDANAESPNWREIVERVCRKREAWSYFLVDTFSKETNFWAALGGREGVRELFCVCKEEKIKLALAGSLKIDDIDRLADEIGELPAVIAVRGAACKDGIRTNPIDRDRVSALLRRIMAAEVRINRRGGSGSCG